MLLKNLHDPVAMLFFVSEDERDGWVYDIQKAHSQLDDEEPKPIKHARGSSGSGNLKPEPERSEGSAPPPSLDCQKRLPTIRKQSRCSECRIGTSGWSTFRSCSCSSSSSNADKVKGSDCSSISSTSAPVIYEDWPGYCTSSYETSNWGSFSTFISTSSFRNFCTTTAPASVTWIV